MSKLDEVFTCSRLNSDFKPVKRSEINAELKNRMSLERELCKRVLEENTKYLLELDDAFTALNNKDYELKELEERLKKTQKLELDLRRENEQLKELLKRAKGLMNCTKDYACTEATEEMIAKISQALGEE